MRDISSLKDKIIGLGETSMKKSYYPSLQQRLEELNRFKALINAMSDILIIIRCDDFKIMDVNDATCDFFDIKYQNMTKKTLNDLIEIPFFIFIRDLLISSINDKNKFTKPLETNFVVKSESNELTYLDISIKSSVFSGVEYAIVIAKKANERIKMLQQLQESERKYRELVEFLPVVFFEMDNYGRFTYINHHGVEKFGYTYEDIRDLTVFDVIHPEDREKAIINIQRRLRGEDFAYEEYRLVTKDGFIITAIIESRPIFKENKVVGLRGVAIDMKDRKNVFHAQKQPSFINSMKDETILINLSSKNILVVSDTEGINTLSDMLKGIGHKVTVCNDSEEAIETYKNSLEKTDRFDLVILDSNTITGIDTLNTLNMLKKVDQDIKAVVSSTNPNNEMIIDPQKYGFKGSLLQPTNIFEVVGVIRDILKN